MGQLESQLICVIEETSLAGNKCYRPYVKLFYNVYFFGFRILRYKVEKSVRYINSKNQYQLIDTFLPSHTFPSIKEAKENAQKAIDNWKAEIANNTIVSRKEILP